MNPSPFIFRQRGLLMPGIMLGMFTLNYQNPTPVNFGGIAFAILSIAIRFLAAGQILSNPNSLTIQSSGLSHQGIYAMCRHPLYLSNILAALGWVLFFNPYVWTALLSVFLVVLFYHYIALLEEKELKQNYPSEYLDYVKKTRRWVPNLGFLGQTSWEKIKPLPQIWNQQQKNFLWLTLSYSSVPVFKLLQDVF